MNRNRFFIGSLLFPMLALLILTLYKSYSLESGIRFVLPISGYDPVNPISGHFVTYRVDYGANVCNDFSKKADPSCICLRKGKEANHSYVPSCNKSLLQECDAFLKGSCKYGRFEAGIEEYFIPENKAEAIDKTVRKGKSKIQISVTRDGKAMVEDLILVDE